MRVEWLALALCMLIGLALPAPGTEVAVDPQGETPYEAGAEGPLVIEAERYHLDTAQDGHTWTPETTLAGFQGPGYLRALPEDDALTNDYNGAHADYAVQLQAATYYPWIRTWAPDSGGDSAHIGLDGKANTTADRIQAASIGSWSWTNATMDPERATLAVAADGLYHLNLWMRESGLAVDRILLTTDPTYTPQGDGPAESTQAGDWLSPQVLVAETGEALTLGWDAQPNADWFEVRLLLEDGSYTPIVRTTEPFYKTAMPKSRVVVFEVRAGNAEQVSGWATSADPTHARVDGEPRGFLVVGRPAPPTDPVIE
jgi:hypothetical protein